MSVFLLPDPGEQWSSVPDHGADYPDPPPGLSDADAYSAARRSPRVRLAQARGSRRPDLLARVNALEV